MRFLPLILLAACSPSEPDAPVPSSTAAAAPERVATPTPAPRAAALATPTNVRIFRDWAVACDNGRACRATILAAEVAIDLPFALAITRAAAPAAQPQVDFDEAGNAHGVFSIDGRPVDGALTAVALADGHTLSVTPGTQPSATLSLAGLSAALRYMDDVQRRAGTITAIVARGPRPASTVPVAPPLPRIVQPAASRKPPRTLTVGEATRLIGPAYAACDYAIGKVEPEAHRLDLGHSVVIVAHPCGNGAYNLSSSVFVVDEDGRATRATLDGSAGMNPADRHLIVNGDWDPATRRLTSFSKGRGLGDCGVSQSFAWDGTRFRLAEQREMSECRGSRDYLPTWRAAVVAR